MKKKKAKLSQRISKFFAKIFKRKRKKTTGNYRYRSRWSSVARSLVKRPRVWLSEPLAQKAFYYVHGVMDIYVAYSEVFQLQAANLGRALMRDIYTPEVLPYLSCGRLLNDSESIELMNEELFDLLNRYGGGDLLYDSGADISSDDLKNDHVIPLGQNIYLVPWRNGMAVRDFLLWYKGGVEIPSAVLTEWSDLPESHFVVAYRGLVDFLRNTLINEHREQLATNQAPSKHKKLKDPDVIYV